MIIKLHPTNIHDYSIVRSVLSNHIILSVSAHRVQDTIFACQVPPPLVRPLLPATSNAKYQLPLYKLPILFTHRDEDFFLRLRYLTNPGTIFCLQLGPYQGRDSDPQVPNTDCGDVVV